jgi:hypothetical protein
MTEARELSEFSLTDSTAMGWQGRVFYGPQEIVRTVEGASEGPGADRAF